MSDRTIGLLFLAAALLGVLLVAWMVYIPGATWWSVALSAVGGAAAGFGIVWGAFFLWASRGAR